MYESCVTCLKAGTSCREPRITDMSIEEAIVLMKARKKFLGYSNQYIADRCTPKMAKGTIDGIFAATHADFRFETIRPVWNVLFGGEVPDNLCPELSEGERGKYEEKIRELEKLLDYEVRWRDDKIKHFETMNDSLQTLVANTNARATQDKDFLKSELKRKNKIIGIIGSFLGIALAVIITALIVDRLNDDMGFFWLRSWFDGSGNGLMQRLKG